MKYDVCFPGGRTTLRMAMGCLPRKGEEIRIPAGDFVVRNLIYVEKDGVHEPVIDCEKIG